PAPQAPLSPAGGAAGAEEELCFHRGEDRARGPGLPRGGGGGVPRGEPGGRDGGGVPAPGGEGPGAAERRGRGERQGGGAVPLPAAGELKMGRTGGNPQKPLIFLKTGAIITMVIGRMMKEWGDPLFC